MCIFGFMGAGEFHKKTIPLPLPSRFKPLIEKEMETLGVYTFVQVMEHIMETYFNGNGHKAGAHVATTIAAAPEPTPKQDPQQDPVAIPGKQEEDDKPWVNK